MPLKSYARASLLSISSSVFLCVFFTKFATSLDLEFVRTERLSALITTYLSRKKVT